MEDIPEDRKNIRQLTLFYMAALYHGKNAAVLCLGRMTGHGTGTSCFDLQYQQQLKAGKKFVVIGYPAPVHNDIYQLYEACAIATADACPYVWKRFNYKAGEHPIDTVKNVHSNEMTMVAFANTLKAMKTPACVKVYEKK